jgi:hypothetical protein
MAAWPSGKAKDCKSFIPRFESGRRLQNSKRDQLCELVPFCLCLQWNIQLLSGEFSTVIADAIAATSLNQPVLVDGRIVAVLPGPLKLCYQEGK